MRLEEFQYDLPPELVAQNPATPRDSSKLMILDRGTGMVSHHIFKDLPDFLLPGDLLVMNDSYVIPARLNGRKKCTGGKVELLLLRPISENRWEVLVRPGKRLPSNSRIIFGDGKLEACIVRILPDGSREVDFYYNGDFNQIINMIGVPPLPPYINSSLLSLSDLKDRYQTVYADANGIKRYYGNPWGSVAAPTAGLHFTPELLSSLKDKGISISFVTLHVGWGTFRSVTEKDISRHQMHEEWFTISHETVKVINKTKANGNKVVAVGSTSCRVLEQCAENNLLKPMSGWTNFFITPGYKFKCVDSLITNFHLPETTLLMLVAAFADINQILNAYDLAIKEKYRFFSFGDAMLIL